MGWYGQNSGDRLHPVGEKPANPFGLFDVHGNVWEWCRDWYDNYDLPVNGGDGERIVSDGYFRVIRGGSFSSGAQYARSACRGGLPGDRGCDLGFRPAKAHP